MAKRKRSLMWEFFQPSFDDKASCNLCKLNFSYKTTTTNLKRHLERRHPTLLVSEKCPNISDSETDALKADHSNDAIEELLGEESIFIEYCDDPNENQEKDYGTEKDHASKHKILRIPISKKLPAEYPETEKKEFSSKFSGSEDPRNELIKIEFEIAKKDLELKERQLIYAKREDERRQKEHEVTLKIKEAQLQAILNKKN